MRMALNVMHTLIYGYVIFKGKEEIRGELLLRFQAS